MRTQRFPSRRVLPINQNRMFSQGVSISIVLVGPTSLVDLSPGWVVFAAHGLFLVAVYSNATHGYYYQKHEDQRLVCTEKLPEVSVAVGRWCGRRRSQQQSPHDEDDEPSLVRLVHDDDDTGNNNSKHSGGKRNQVLRPR
jgi:hypothetical protein